MTATPRGGVARAGIYARQTYVLLKPQGKPSDATGKGASAKAAKKTAVPVAVTTSEQFSRPEPLPSSVAPPEHAAAAPETVKLETPEGDGNDAASASSAAAAPTPTVVLQATYVLVGAGTATASALRAIRKRDPSAKVPKRVCAMSFPVLHCLTLMAARHGERSSPHHHHSRFLSLAMSPRRRTCARPCPKSSGSRRTPP